MTKALSAGVLAAVALALATSGADRAQAGARTERVKVMSRNLFLGVDIRRASSIAAPTPERLAEVGIQLFNEVAATDVPGRMRLVAREIDQVDPHLVGLQEVTLWQLGSRKLDYLDLLRKALRARGLSYRVVAAVSEADVTTSTPEGTARFSTGNAILVRRGVITRNLRTGIFTSQIDFPLADPPGTQRVRRNWGELDANVSGARFHVVETHLEAFATNERLLQAQELLARPLRHRAPVVLVGDLNSNANLSNPDDRPPFLAIRGAGYVVRQTRQQSCCYKDDLKTGRLDHTVDFVMTKPRLGLVASGRTGVSAKTRAGTYAADHVGIWSTLRIPR